jgi:putative membrane protein insertion efficiency factor
VQSTETLNGSCVNSLTGQDSSGWLTSGLIALVRSYQRTVSEVTPHRCRFQPTCSEFMVEAIHRYGALRGLWMGLKRIARCHPFSESRYDPVPDILVKSKVQSRD